MKISIICLLACSVIFGSCKSKLEKKDKSLEEMQNEEGNPENYVSILGSASESPVYKKINDSVDMRLNIYYPQNHVTNAPSPVIVYFFGGGFVQGSPIQFEEHCKYFAGRGIVAITADYRVISRNKGNGMNCIFDGKSAIRYIREHARELNIDPNRIAVAGGSAGGFLALECALDDSRWQDPTDNAAISCVPNALVLLNPVVNAVEHQFRIAKFQVDEKDPASQSFAGEIDPMTHIHSGMPPGIIFHGTADKISAITFVQKFTDDYNAAGNKMQLVKFEGEKHGFTTMQYKNGKFFIETLKQTDQFLIDLGYLKGKPTVENVVIPKAKPNPKANQNKKNNSENLKNKKIIKAPQPTDSI